MEAFTMVRSARIFFMCGLSGTFFMISSVLLSSFFHKKNTPQNDALADTSLVTKPNDETLPILQENPLYWDWDQIDSKALSFPKDFIWGVATSAHQVEGSCNNDWTAWELDNVTTPTGKACDHWNRYKTDIQLIKDLGVNSYRFSVEWSKIEPQPGVFDQNALDHYKDLCIELSKQKIKPFLTLHHYTSPAWFAERGGFEKPENIHYFVRFCSKVFETLHPFIYRWITFNSPTSYVARAYHEKMAPPGVENMQLMQEVLKNILEAHVQVYHTLKELPQGKDAQIGILHNIYHIEPASSWDSWGASMARSLFDTNVYEFFTTGVFNVSIPFKVSLKHCNKKAIGALDFVGLNYYSHGIIKNFNVTACKQELATLNDMYTIYPEGLYRAIVDISQNLAKPLNIPIYITENGIATDNEQHRELFFKRYLFALSQAIKEGYDVRGYIVWSLMDNYEWGSYQKPYGIYKVDFATQERTREGRQGAQYFLDIVQQFS